jgi:hypothetical protein
MNFNAILRPLPILVLYTLVPILSAGATPSNSHLPTSLLDPCVTGYAKTGYRPNEVIRIELPKNLVDQRTQLGLEKYVGQPDPGQPSEFTLYDLIALMKGRAKTSYFDSITFDSRSYSPQVTAALRLALEKSQVQINSSDKDWDPPHTFRLSGLNPRDPELLAAALNAVPHAVVAKPAMPTEWKEFKTLLQYHNILVENRSESVVIVKNPNNRGGDRLFTKLEELHGSIDFLEMLSLLRETSPRFENQSFSISGNGANSVMRDVIHQGVYLQDTWVVLAKIEGRNNTSLAARIHAKDIDDLTTIVYWPYRTNQARVRVNYIRGEPTSLETMVQVENGWLPAIYIRDKANQQWVQQETYDGKPILHLCMECHGIGANFGPSVKLISRNQLAPGYFNYQRPAGFDPMFGEALKYSPTAGNNSEKKYRNPTEDLIHAFRDGRIYRIWPQAVWDFQTRKLIPLGTQGTLDLQALGLFGNPENKPPTTGVFLPQGLLSPP